MQQATKNLIGRILVRVGAFLQVPAIGMLLAAQNASYAAGLSATGLLLVGVGYELEQGPVNGNAPGPSQPPAP